MVAEIAQWIEHLLHKREDLSSTSQVYIKSCGQWGSHVIPGLGKWRQTEPWGH